MKRFTFLRQGRPLLMLTAAVMAFVGTATAQKKGTFTDKRDGKTYKTVKIGKQTWMAQSLNIQTGNSWCHENNDSNCDKYGRLYNWDAAKTACPIGWHLPTYGEWGVLTDAAGGFTVAGKALKSVSGWKGEGNGTDKNGFSALPGGQRSRDGDFDVSGGCGYWWTATTSHEDLGYNYYMCSHFDEVNKGFSVGSFGYSVRCVKDE